MAKMINKKDALAAVNALQEFDLESVGVKMPSMTAKSARDYLTKAGVKGVDSLSDKAAVIVRMATVNMDKASNAAKSAALEMGILSITNQWKAVVAPDGKPYKSENAFLRDFFPGYAVSTTSLYADVGKSIYIPVLQKWSGYEGLDFLVDLSPSNAKFLLATVKDEDKRALLPAAFEANKANDGSLKQAAIVKMAKEIKDKLESSDESDSSSDSNESNASPDNAAVPKNDKEAADIKGQLQGSLTFSNAPTVQAKVRLAFAAAKNDADEIAAIVSEQYITDFIALLTKGAGDANIGMTICSELAKIITTAASAQ